MRRQLAALLLFATIFAPANAAAQEAPPSRQCPEWLTCRTTEVNLQNYLNVPLTLQGVSSCAQFCSATYWVRHAQTGEVLSSFGHSGPMGPPLLAWSGISELADTSVRVRTVVWVGAPNARGMDDGWYEDTAYTWDAPRQRLVRGSTRRWEPEQRDRMLRTLADEDLQLVFTP